MPVPDPAAVNVRLCHPGGLKPVASASVLLSQNDANNIGKLLDLAPASSANCEHQPDAVLRFNYDDGTEADVEIFAVPQPDDTGCDQPTASVAGRVWLLPPALASFLDADPAALGAKGNPPPAPSVTGLSLAEATQVITHAGMTVYSGGRVTDPLLSPDTVVLQDPPAGAVTIGSGAEVDLLLSQQPAPACTATQLALDYHGVQYGTGNAFSDIDVRDVGATPCTLTGPISVVGLDAAGHAVTNRLTFPVAEQLILTARAPARAVDGGSPIDVVIAWVPLQANVRDGPDAGGSCADHLVVPKTWLLTVGGRDKPVPNGAGIAEPPMSACQGRLNVTPTPSPITSLG